VQPSYVKNAFQFNLRAHKSFRRDLSSAKFQTPVTIASFLQQLASDNGVIFDNAG